MAVTSPDAETLASPGAPLDQLTGRPGKGWLLALNATAESWTVDPTMMLDVAGLTDTVATGSGVTVTEAVPDFPSLVAVIVAEPVAIPVTSPPDETVATAVLFDEKLTGLPESGFPCPSVGLAVSCVVRPTLIDT
jgi:hypothetical protein